MQEKSPRILRAIMFTDMVGYTRLMGQDEQLALRMRDKHRSVLQKGHAAFNGEIVRYFGDGTLSLFANPLDAVLCAIEMQREFTKPLAVPLRIGIHLGDVIIHEDAISGDAVNIASRMESFSVPGGVLVSDTVHNEIKNQPQIEMVSLGKYRLKNVERPYEIFAISADGLTVPDPAHLAGKGERAEILSGNLPSPSSPLLGRERDIKEVTGYLQNNRVVTITGPGGIGKTRLALEISHRLVDEFPGRLAFVPMDTVSDPAGFIPALALALNIKEAEGRGYRAGIVAVIGDSRALLVLDNLEQIIAAAADVVELIAKCAKLKILATSRTPLKIGAEQEYPLWPLALPQQEQSASFAEVMASPAVALFADRAGKANHLFQITPENAPTVAQICHRLDGLPLALELAAARVRMLPPDALLARLSKSLDVLGRGPRDLPARHQRLRTTIEWSHDLLSDSEKQLFRRLAVFSGGFSLEGVETICLGDGNGWVLDDLESLLEQGLVRHAVADGIADASTSLLDRYTMLQTIKEFAWEKLEAAGELAELRGRHARYLLDVARRIHLATKGHDQLPWLARARQEEANMQNALEWSLELAQAGDEAAAELGLQICGELWMYWHIRGLHLNARRWVDSFLDTAGGQRDSAATCKALLTAGLVSWTLGQFPRAIEELRRCYLIAASLDLGYEMASAASCLMICYLPLGDVEQAGKWARDGIEVGQRLNLQWILAFTYAFDGLLSLVTGDLEAAEAKYGRALGMLREVGDYNGRAFSLGGLAQLAVARGDGKLAVQQYQEALESYRLIGDRAEQARILEEMAWTTLTLNQASFARDHFCGSIQAYNDVGSVRGIGLALFGLAACEHVEGSSYRAAQITAAAERYSEQEGIVNHYTENHTAMAYIEAIKVGLPADRLEQATEEGRKMVIDDVLALAGTSP